VPDIDATIVERNLDAGGEIAGAVWNITVSGGSHTSPTGPVQIRGKWLTTGARRPQRR
jgi:hypothetical protein